MKRSFLFPLLAMNLTLAVFPACGDDSHGDEPQVEETLTVSVDQKALNFSYKGGDEERKTLVVKSNKFVKAVCDETWCSLVASTGANGEYPYTVTCSTNTASTPRTATIRIVQVTKELATVTVTQEGRPAATEIDTKATIWGLGWNMGNQFDAQNNGVSSETAWGNPACTAATFAGVKKAGFESVRIPVTWLGHIGEAPDYKIEDAWMDQVARAVDYAEKADLKAIINIHHDGADSKYWLNIKEATASEEKNQAITAELVAIWTQIAKRFSDKGDFLAFEIVNEIHDGGWGWGDNRNDGGKQYAVLNGWLEACHKAIRQEGGNNATRWIGIPAYCTNIDIAIGGSLVTSYFDEKTAVAVHCYDPYDFTLANKIDQWGTASDKSTLEKTLKKLDTHFISKGIPVYIGEFGCTQRAKDADEHYRLEYLEYFAKVARKFGISCFVWDNGSDNGGKGGQETNAFMNHGTGNYLSAKGKAAVESLVKGWSSVE